MKISWFIPLIFIALFALTACMNTEGAESEDALPELQDRVHELEQLTEGMFEENKLLLDERDALEEDNILLSTTVESLEEDYRLLQLEMEALEEENAAPQQTEEAPQEKRELPAPVEENEPVTGLKGDESEPASFSNIIANLEEADVHAEILANAEAVWPNDEHRKDLVIEQQTAAYEKLKGTVLTSALEEEFLKEAFEDWSFDFLMLDSAYQEQLTLE